MDITLVYCRMHLSRNLKLLQFVIKPNFSVQCPPYRAILPDPV